jgi:uncharacterized protein
MLRTLIIVAIVILLYLLIKNRLKAGKSKTSNTSKASNSDGSASKHKKTVPCLECDTYIPDSEAIIYDNRYFCCQQHLRDWQSRQTRQN